MHTHDDLGWMESYREYFAGTGPVGCSDDSACNVSKIIGNVVTGLLRDPRRIFSYSEMGFFEIWFEAQAPELQAQVRALVARGQLVFLGGGWCMPDEATASATDMLDSLAVGHRAIVEQFGESALPSLAWQIDPFGHSAFMGLLSSKLNNADGVMWSRESYALYAASRASATLERVWTPSASQAAVATFQGTFAAYNYATVAGCRRCDQGSPFNGSGCTYALGHADGVLLADEIIKNIAPAFRGNDVMLLFGQDFTGANAVIEPGGADAAEGYFRYVEGIIDALNADAQGRFNASFSSPAAYVRAKLGGASAAPAPPLPVYAGDFFPLIDDEAGHQVWSGFFSSRTALKGFVRQTSALHQQARQLQVAARSAEGGPGPSNPLFRLERAMGVAQHHDAVSGTATEAVTGDYAQMLETGRADALAGVGADIAALTGYADGYAWQPCALLNVSLCPSLEDGRATVVVLHNPLAQDVPAAPVRLPVGLPAGVASFAVTDADGVPIIAQLVPLSARDEALRALYGGRSDSGVQWLCFCAALPTAGFTTVFILPVPTRAAAPHTHASEVWLLSGGADEVVSNGRISVTISAATGWPSAYADAFYALSQPLTQTWAYYIGFDGNSTLNGSKEASGQYIFRPASPQTLPVSPAPASVTLVRGPVVNASLHAAGWVTQETRLWAGAESVEVEYTVGPVNVSDGQSREVISVWETGLASAGALRTDANCREMQTRIRGTSSGNFSANLSEPVSGNYAPVTCLATLSSPDTTLAVAVDRAQGGASLRDGTLELMVMRRMQHLDGREPLGEVLDEPGLDGKGIVVRGRHWLLVAPRAAAPRAYKAAHVRAMSAPASPALALAGLGQLSPAQWRAAFTARAALLAAPLPPSLHLLTAHALGGGALLLRLAHVFDAGEDAELSRPVAVDLAPLLAGAGLTIVAAADATMSGALALADVAPRTYTTDGGAAFTVPQLPAPPAGGALTVVLGPQQIRTLRCTVQVAEEPGSSYPPVSYLHQVSPRKAHFYL